MPSPPAPTTSSDHGPQGGLAEYGVASPARPTWSSRPEDVGEALRDRGRLDLNKARRPHRRAGLQRASRYGKHYGTVVIAEGLAELLPDGVPGELTRDEHGHAFLGKVEPGKLVAKTVASRYEAHRSQKSSPVCSSATSRAHRRRMPSM